jgi:murein L,D-transpeptidase YafK
VLADIGPRHRPALEREARARGIAYPPPELVLVGLKAERMLEVWARAGERWTLYRSYPVLAASGGPGPKLREGDLQVPEGVYRLTHLNPASSYHLSIRVDYPNAFDRERGAQDGRRALGGDIYIHGKAVSTGCLAIGDEKIEELFTLVADTGLAHARIVLAPGRALDVPAGAPPWTPALYRAIARELARLG